jgi:hypothetical protein
VPQLIPGYTSEPAMDARAAPVLGGWLVLGTILHWGTRQDWPLAANVLGITVTLAWMAIAWAVVRRFRGRPAFGSLPTFDLVDIATLAALPALPAAVIESSALELVASAVGALTGIGVVYLIVGFGLIDIGRWALEGLWQQLTYLVELIARTLPILLIFVVFLPFESEIWQVAHSISGLELGVLVVLLMLLSGLFIATAFRRELRQLESGSTTDRLLDEAHGTPAEGLLGARRDLAMEPPRLSWLQRANLTLLVVVPTLLQAAVAALVVALVLAALAGFIITDAIQASWIGAAPRTIVTLVVLDEPRALTAEVLIVSSMLGGIVGLYFSGLAVTDPAYRAQQFDRDVAGVARLLAARAVYLAALRSTGAT